jgi:hypothetical protein
MGSGSYSNSNPQPLGATPAPGVVDEASRADHVHPLPSAADIGLGNVNNTSDLNKPISTATQTALDGKAAETHSHTTGDITGFGAAAAAAAPVQSVAGKTGTVTLAKADVGLGNVDNTTDLNKPISTATQTALDGKAAATHSHATGDITGFSAAAAAAAPVQSVAGKTGVVTLAKADVGLGNVDNTTDLGKPISTATQTALDGKAAATHSHTAGADGSVQYKSGTVFAGATNVAISSGDLSLATSSSPTSPASGSLKPIAKPLSSGGSPRLLLKTPNGTELDVLCPDLRRRYGFVGFGSSGQYTAGIRAMNVTGTIAGQNMASGSGKIRTQTTSTIASGTTAGSIAGLQISPLELWLSDGAGAGGFLVEVSFGVGDSISDARMFVGLTTSTGAGTNVSPATLTNCIGVGHDAGETAYSLYYGGSAAQTPISLGANFPVNTTDLMQIILFSSPGVSGVIEWVVRRYTMTAMFEASGSLGPLTSTQFPQAGTQLGRKFWRTNNATASDAILVMNKITEERY